MSKYVKRDLSGSVFGRLTVLCFVPDDTRRARYLCLCQCGNKKLYIADALVSGGSVSCGCYRKEKAREATVTHGHNGINRSKTYNSWAGMMDRCEWGGHSSYERYGAKGIRVCAEWHDFNNFLNDMGIRPEGTSIDRINNNLGYYKNNCRWATRLEQALNRSNTKYVIYEGIKTTAHELRLKLCLSKKALDGRVYRRNGDYIGAFRSFGIMVEEFKDIPGA